MVPPRLTARGSLRRRIERLDGLPIRASSARFVLSELPIEGMEPTADIPATDPLRQATDHDPGWTLLVCRSDRGGFDPLRAVAENAWWQPMSAAAAEALSRLWRHAAATRLAARRLAREAGDPDPDFVARAGSLCALGLWAVAAADPEWLPEWLAFGTPEKQAEFERETLGSSVSALGRRLAERWGLEPLLVDAAWLHGDSGLRLPEGDELTARRLDLLKQAHAWAEQTPWSLVSRGPTTPGSGSHDPRLKLLTAEVQARCGGPFVEPEGAPREERLARENALLRRRVMELDRALAARDRFLDAFATSDSTESPESWAERAGLAWCGVPGVASARVAWGEEPDARELPTPSEPSFLDLPLNDGPRTVATISLHTEGQAASDALLLGATLPAWRAWAVAISRRVRLEARLDGVMSAYRELARREEPRLRRAKLEALAEFAAGAGHELNNPLAVVVGRAQLLLARAGDPQTSRSLRAILTQAQRAHRILRDLMYVARPPLPRPRFCHPDEIWKLCLRDLRGEADERQVRLVADAFEHGKRVWADPDALRHLADSLTRNALEATPPGGTIRVATSGDASALRWSVRDTGRGITDVEGDHLFDPFYCGRQAGRGLGMGLPRAARFVEASGGQIRWHSLPGQGSTFSVHLPLAEPPKPPASDGDAMPPPNAASASTAA